MSKRAFSSSKIEVLCTLSQAAHTLGKDINSSQERSRERLTSFENRRSQVKPFKGSLEVDQSLLEVMIMNPRSKALDINAQDKEGMTPLHWASENGYSDIVDYLVSKEASLERRDSMGMTAFHKAAYGGHEKVITTLVGGKSLSSSMGLFKKAGQDSSRDVAKDPTFSAIANDLLPERIVVNMQDKKGMTALHHAAAKGSTGWIEKLFELGADCSQIDYQKRIPLHWASEGGFIECIELLLKHLAPNLEMSADAEGMTPFLLASSKGHTDIVELFLGKGAHVDEGNNAGRTGLHLAALGGHLDVVELLWDKNANLNTKDGSGNTPLHCAVDSGNNELVATLLFPKDENGTLQAVIDAKNSEGFTPFHKAVMKGDKQIVTTFLLKSPDLALGKTNGKTVLDWASQKGYVEVVKALLFLKPKESEIINSSGNDGITPLHSAARAGQLEVVKALVELEAALDLQNKEGYTAACCAAKNGHEDVAIFLLEKLARVQSKDCLTSEETAHKPVLYRAAYVGDTNMVTSGLTADLKASDVQWILYYAALGGSEDLVEMLIMKIKEMSEKSATALHHAVKNKKKGAAAFLILHGVVAKAINAEKKTALDIAVQAGYKEELEVLLKASIVRSILETAPIKCDKEMKELFTYLCVCKRRGIEDPVRSLILPKIIELYKDEVSMTLLYRLAQDPKLWEEGFDEGFHVFCIKAMKLVGFSRCIELISKCSFKNIQGLCDTTNATDKKVYNADEARSLLKYMSSQRQWRVAIIAWLGQERSKARMRARKACKKKVLETL